MNREFKIGEVIAERRMTYATEDGNVCDVAVRIGRPILDSIAGVEHWVCPFQITGVGDDAVKA